MKTWWELRAKRQAMKGEQSQLRNDAGTRQTPKEAATRKFERKQQHTKQRYIPWNKTYVLILQSIFLLC